MYQTADLFIKLAAEQEITEQQKSLLSSIWSTLSDILGFSTQLSNTLEGLVDSNYITGHSIRAQVMNISVSRIIDIGTNTMGVIVLLLESMDQSKVTIEKVKNAIRNDLKLIVKANKEKLAAT